MLIWACPFAPSAASSPILPVSSGKHSGWDQSRELSLLSIMEGWGSQVLQCHGFQLSLDNEMMGCLSNITADQQIFLIVILLKVIITVVKTDTN